MAETDFHPYEEGAADGGAKLVGLGAKGDTVNTIILSSIAISLKRIADALEANLPMPLSGKSKFVGR